MGRNWGSPIKGLVPPKWRRAGKEKNTLFRPQPGLVSLPVARPLFRYYRFTVPFGGSASVTLRAVGSTSRRPIRFKAIVLYAQGVKTRPLVLLDPRAKHRGLHSWPNNFIILPHSVISRVVSTNWLITVSSCTAAHRTTSLISGYRIRHRWRRLKL